MPLQESSTHSKHLSGSISSSHVNPRAGLKAKIVLNHDIANKNIMIDEFGKGNTASASTTAGLLSEINKNGHSLGVEYKPIDNFGKSLTGMARLNLLQNDNHKLDAVASHTRTHLDNGFKFSRNSAGLDYNHAAGHGLSLTGSHIPQVGMKTLDLTGRGNLWKSPDRSTTLDLMGGGTKHISGPFTGQFERKIGFSLTSHF